jgi:hypothetical protein
MVEARGGVVCIFHIDISGLGDMAHRILGDGCALMDSRRREAPFWHHGGIDSWSGVGLRFGLSP